MIEKALVEEARKGNHKEGVSDHGARIDMKTIVRDREEVVRILLEALRQGTAGAVLEARLLTQDWGLDFDNMRQNKIHIWHGTRDANAPIATIREIARRLPSCEFREYPEDDHSSMITNHLDEVFEELMPDKAGDGLLRHGA